MMKNKRQLERILLQGQKDAERPVKGIIGRTDDADEASIYDGVSEGEVWVRIQGVAEPYRALIVDPAAIVPRASVNLTYDIEADKWSVTGVNPSINSYIFQSEGGFSFATQVHDHTTTATGGPLGDNTVTTNTITDGNVTTIKLADDAVTTAKVASGAITATELANDAVTTVKILNANVTTAKIATGAVTANELASNAVTTAKILDTNVTNGKIADGAVTTIKIFDNAVTNAKIVDNAVSTSKIQDNAVNTAKLNLSGTFGERRIGMINDSTGNITPRQRYLQRLTGSDVVTSGTTLSVIDAGTALDVDVSNSALSLHASLSILADTNGDVFRFAFQYYNTVPAWADITYFDYTVRHALDDREISFTDWIGVSTPNWNSSDKRVRLTVRQITGTGAIRIYGSGRSMILQGEY